MAVDKVSVEGMPIESLAVVTGRQMDLSQMGFPKPEIAAAGAMPSGPKPFGINL